MHIPSILLSLLIPLISARLLQQGKTITEQQFTEQSTSVQPGTRLHLRLENGNSLSVITDGKPYYPQICGDLVRVARTPGEWDIQVEYHAPILKTWEQKQREAETQKPFWRRYWMYFVIPLLIMVLMPQPAEEEGEAAKQPAVAAPAAAQT